MRRLTEDEFKATAVPERERVGLDEEPPFDFWEYFDLNPPEEFSEHDFSKERMSYAWNRRGTVYRHILAECQKTNVYCNDTGHYAVLIR
jgi:hypothetical protein